MINVCMIHIFHLLHLAYVLIVKMCLSSSCIFFQYIFIYLATCGLSCCMWDLVHLTRNQTQAPYIRSSES